MEFFYSEDAPLWFMASPPVSFFDQLDRRKTQIFPLEVLAVLSSLQVFSTIVDACVSNPSELNSGIAASPFGRLSPGPLGSSCISFLQRHPFYNSCSAAVLDATLNRAHLLAKLPESATQRLSAGSLPGAVSLRSKAPLFGV